ncbi:C2H2 transcription factor [Metarhizium album ARSEF 1941]|uniref:C2H2 transcription factor n=1 Tax=Metarhizium album (strain ARSEF 1941) TaxID=1081103 RepID=A0A0B2WYE7_METAS|nr:C2H2 transcription factor [Metarhizium album ARSEF 1941]KHO01267.1 C2H2 transcription factor [Metarhizium album ARSEF 1941]
MACTARCKREPADIPNPAAAANIQVIPWICPFDLLSIRYIAMTSLESAIGGMDQDEIVAAFSDSETHAEGSETLKTPNRSGKAQFDRTFQCNVEGCEKSYSRAGHLYRHQLNRMFILFPEHDDTEDLLNLVPWRTTQ